MIIHSISSTDHLQRLDVTSTVDQRLNLEALIVTEKIGAPSTRKWPIPFSKR